MTAAKDATAKFLIDFTTGADLKVGLYIYGPLNVGLYIYGPLKVGLYARARLGSRSGGPPMNRPIN